MSQQHEIKFEIINPNNIESDVPREQSLREGTDDYTSGNDDNASKYDDNASSNNNLQYDEELEDDTEGDYITFVPVMMVTKKEAVYTKGDLKLQKVSVTEDISENNTNGVNVVANPLYSEVKSEVISGPQPVRHGEPGYERELEDGEKDKNVEDKKPRTKIPTFKQTAQNMRRERRDKKESEVQTAQNLRSSIPRTRMRKRSKTPPPPVYTNEEVFEEETVKNDNIVKIDADEKLEDEFDKMYDEMIDTKDTEGNIDENVFTANIGSPKKLESNFEDIIHAYDEKKFEPIVVDKSQSKIPLMKQKSMYEVKPRRVDRRSSLKTPEVKSKVPNTLEVKDKNDLLRPKASQDVNKKSVNNMLHKVEIISKESSKKDNTENTSKVAQQSITNRPKSKEAVKVSTPITDKVDNKVKNVIKTVPNNGKEKTKLQNDSLNTGMPMSTKLVRSISTRSERSISNKCKPKEEKNKINPEPLSSSTIKTPTIQKTASKEELRKRSPEKDKVKDKDISQTSRKEFTSELPKKKSIVSKIAIFTGSKKEKATDALKQHLPSTSDVPPTKPQNESLPEKQAEIKDEELASNENYFDPSIVNKENQEKIDDILDEFDELLASIPYIQPKEEENNNIKISDKVLEYNITVSLKEPEVESGKEASNTKNVVQELDPEEETNIKEIKEIPVLKGKVSSIISRIDSHDESIPETSKKEIMDEIPKKKSVSSRIAMFEQAPKDVTPKITRHDSNLPNSIHKENTPPKTIIEKPKIIHELLKPQPAPETLLFNDKHTDDNILRNNPVSEKFEVDSDENIKTQQITLTKSSAIYLNVEEIAPVPSQDKPINVVKEIIDVKTAEDQIMPLHNMDEDNVFHETLRAIEKDEVLSNIKNEYTKPPAENELEHKTPEHVNQNIRAQQYKDVFKPNDNDRTRQQKENDDVVFTKIEDRLKRLTSKDDSNLRRTKSIVELDLGDAVKGKVHQMIVRINSVEKLDEDKKEIINIKERPRKKSVSEKIAMFERKLVPVKMSGSIDQDRAFRIDPKARVTEKTNISEEDCEQRISELTNAKIKYGRMENMMYIRLRNGEDMPVLALGTALMDPRLVPHIIGAALELGYRAIDCAPIYGNEAAVGQAIRAKIDDGTVKREELFITSKLWSSFHRRELVERACRQSLAAMGLEYFDLYLVHNPMSFKEGGDLIPKIANVLQYSQIDYMDAWYGMEGLVTKGLVKSIGVSNFNSEQIARVVEKGRVKPAVNQVECHPYLSQQRLDQFCSEREVKLSCFGVLGSKGTPPNLKSSFAPVIDDPLVKVMAAGLDITPGQLLIRYQIESGHAAVVKASSAEHLWEDLGALGAVLDGTQLDALHALNRNKRTYTFEGMGDTHRNYPFKIAF